MVLSSAPSPVSSPDGFSPFNVFNNPDGSFGEQIFKWGGLNNISKPKVDQIKSITPLIIFSIKHNDGKTNLNGGSLKIIGINLPAKAFILSAILLDDNTVEPWLTKLLAMLVPLFSMLVPWLVKLLAMLVPWLVKLPTIFPAWPCKLLLIEATLLVKFLTILVPTSFNLTPLKLFLIELLL